MRTVRLKYTSTAYLLVEIPDDADADSIGELLVGKELDGILSEKGSYRFDHAGEVPSHSAVPVEYRYNKPEFPLRKIERCQSTI